MKKTAGQRQSNIELLRIVAILGVIILHYNNPSMGGGLKYVEANSLNFYVLYALESLFCCAVNLFIMISGYFMYTTNKRTLLKPFQLVLQVMLFSVSIRLLTMVIGSSEWSVKKLVGAAIPNNYFVILYIALYFVSPYLNVLIARLSNKQLKRMLLLCMILFSVWPTCVDLFGEILGKSQIGLSTVGMYGSQWGYSIVNFVLMYIVGVFMRRCELEDNFKVPSLKMTLWGVFACVITLCVWAKVNDFTGYFQERTAWEYCNPVVIVEAILIFCIFKTMRIGTVKWINKLAEGAFTVFLFHSTLIGRIGVENFVQKNVFIMLLHLMGAAVGIYLVSWGIHCIYNVVMKPVFSCLGTYAEWLLKDVIALENNNGVIDE